MPKETPKYKVMIYNIAEDTRAIREFTSPTGAASYANAMKQFYLDRPDPAPVHIDLL